MDRTTSVKGWKILAQVVKGAPYMIRPYAITRITRKQWEAIHNYDAHFMDDDRHEWKMITALDGIDFSWWSMCCYLLTPRHLREVEARLSFHGDTLTITEY